MEIPGNNYAAVGVEISTEGQIYGFSDGPLGSKGGGPSPMAAEKLQRLDELLAHLPGDGGRLPPPNRRVVVQTPEDSGFRVHVYDRANLPDELLEIIRVTDVRIAPWMPEISPAREWQTYRHEQDSALALSPDGTMLVSGSMNQSLKIWNPSTLELIKEIEIPHGGPSTSLTFSPDGAFMLLEGWGNLRAFETRTWKVVREFEEPVTGNRIHPLGFPHFTPDGRHLLLRCMLPALRIFETGTWAALDSLPGLPPDAMAYAPAPKAARAVYLTKKGALHLWDSAAARDLAVLDASVRIQRVAFSPDETHVVTVTIHNEDAGYWNHARIRIWDAATGRFERELRDHEQDDCESVAALCWTPDGRYVLAAPRAHLFGFGTGIGVWSAESGRQHGNLTTRNGALADAVLLPDPPRAIALSREGLLHVWDLTAAIQQIGDFESSLELAKP